MDTDNKIIKAQLKNIALLDIANKLNDQKEIMQQETRELVKAGILTNEEGKFIWDIMGATVVTTVRAMQDIARVVAQETCMCPECVARRDTTRDTDIDASICSINTATTALILEEIEDESDESTTKH